MKRSLYLSVISVILFMGCFSRLCAQQYTSLSGLIHVPSADMCPEGEARIGAHFLNKKFVPDEAFIFLGNKYHTTNHYLSITPFSWLELGYTATLMKDFKKSNKDFKDNKNNDDVVYKKDRYFSIKIRLLKEAKWWPSIAIGSNDPIKSYKSAKRDDLPDRVKNQKFSNFYLAATKHFDLKGHSLGIHMAYRKWKWTYNYKWDGLVGGITYQPSFQKNLRLIAEYTGDDINIGADYLLWKHLLLQASLQNGKYFSGGACFKINLF